MFDEIIKMFSYDFLIRAVIGGSLIALCAALLGVSLVLKRYSMIGDGLSHVGFGALAIAAAVNAAAPLEFAIPIVVIAAFFLLRISENSKIKGDSAIAIISTASLAIGITVATMTKGMNADINSYLFGSIIAMSQKDIIICIVLSVIVIAMYIFFYHKIFAVTFDESFAKATGTKANIYNMIIAFLTALTAFLTALTITVGMKIMGSLLISSLIIFPAITSMRICKRFKTVVICSGIIAVLCSISGLIISYLYNTPTGASIVLTNVCLLLVFSITGTISDKINAKKFSK